MTKDEAKQIADRLNYIMRRVRAQERPMDRDSEGNVVSHTTDCPTEVIESEIEMLHLFIEQASETPEEREAREQRDEDDAAYYRGLGV